MELVLDVPCTLVQIPDPAVPFPVDEGVSDWNQFRFYGRFTCHARDVTFPCDAHLLYLPNNTRNGVLVILTARDHTWRRIDLPVGGNASVTYRHYIAHALIQEHFMTDGWWSFVNKHF